MYRIEVGRGEETVFRTIEELATAIRNGVVTTRARIYHNASQKWLPIEFHPHYKKALELSVAPSHPVEPARSRAPAPKSSGPRPQVPSHHPASVPHQSTPVSIPAPVPSPVLELTRSPFSPPSFTPHRIAAPEVALALKEPPPLPTALEESPPSAAEPSRSWLRRPIQLVVIGIVAIVCTRVVVSAASPAAEPASSATPTAPGPPLPQTTTAPQAAMADENEPGAVLTAGPAFSPGILTSAGAPKSPAPAPAPPKRPVAAASVAADSIQAAIEPAPTTVDLALPAMPTSDSLAPAPTSPDSSAIGRILRAVTSTKPAPIKAASQ